MHVQIVSEVICVVEWLSTLSLCVCEQKVANPSPGLGRIATCLGALSPGPNPGLLFHGYRMLAMLSPPSYGEMGSAKRIPMYPLEWQMKGLSYNATGSEVMKKCCVMAG